MAHAISSVSSLCDEPFANNHAFKRVQCRKKVISHNGRWCSRDEIYLQCHCPPALLRKSSVYVLHWTHGEPTHCSGAMKGERRAQCCEESSRYTIIIIIILIHANTTSERLASSFDQSHVNVLDMQVLE